ncbi:MAG: TrpR-like protein, YerC/YecD [Oscillospiraceae bacterium]|jgi:TrpR-related protein YerC/YecD|nr:TrpR-like protein, YerC/YecD [Oscillospiraceae bacterium]
MPNPQAHEENLALFYASMATLSRVEDARRLLEDICTPQELRAIAQRLAVAKLLREERVYAEIAGITGASTATISRVRRSMEQSQGGYDAAFGA